VVALVVVLINLGNLMIYVTLGLIPGLEDLAASLPPMAIAALTVLMIPVTLVISALLLLLSGYARSYKEAQLFGFPVQLGLLLPAMAPALPGLPLRSAIVVAPVANAAVAVREVMAGRFDWLMIVAVVVVNVAVGLWIARATTRALREERLISAATQESAELEGGERAFERNIWRWVLVAWALFYLFALNVSDVDLRVQLFFNLVVLFFGVSVVIVRHYRLDVRKVWSLRAPPRMAWVAVAIGVPSGLMVAQGVSAISNLIFPVPEAVLRSFSGSILPEDIPAWQLLPLLSLLPGFCEEIFFRGTLLHALRKRLSPVVLCLVVGLVFGLFHGALFRILPTGSLGVLFTATVLLTRSIYPAMVWHALNNLLGVSIGLAGYDTATLPVWAPVAALPVLGLAFALLWRHRVRGPPD
ncbi:MAG: type II CAAX endopeptidase family protein, partial [Myxococcota bacterium]